MLFFILLFNSLFAADCEIPFPLKDNNNTLKEYCIITEKVYDIGHIRFINLPRARKKSDVWPYSYTYFASTETTRNKLCQLFHAKKELPRSHIYDPAGENIQYSRLGFNITPLRKTIKVLACSLL